MLDAEPGIIPPRFVGAADLQQHHIDRQAATGYQAADIGNIGWNDVVGPVGEKPPPGAGAAQCGEVNLRHAVRLLKAAGVPDVAAVPDDPALTARRLDIVHIVYRPGVDQIPNSDAQFSRSSIAERRAAGYRDMRAARAAEPWLRQEMPAHLGAVVHRVEREKVTTRPEPEPAHDDRQAGCGLTAARGCAAEPASPIRTIAE
jgi:hypothetical protein